MSFKSGKITINKKSFWYSFFAFLPALYYLANIYRMTDHSAIPYALMTCIAGFTGVVLIIYVRKVRQSPLVLAYGLYIITLFFNFLLIRNVNYNDLITDTLLFGIANMMIVYPHSYLQGKVYFYSSILFFVYAYLTGQNTHYILTSSGNYISILLILSMSLYYIGIDNDRRNLKMLDLIPACCCFLLSVWSKGRGGILCCGVFLILLLFIYLCNMARTFPRTFLIIVEIALIAVVIIMLIDITIIDKIINLGKWRTRGIEDEPRFLLWAEYFYIMKDSLLFTLCGVPFNLTHMIRNLGNNPHNSFLYLHATNGIFSFIFYIWLLIQTSFYQFKNGRWVLLATTTTMVLRSMTDKFVFGQYGMPIMLFLLFYPYVDNYILARRQLTAGPQKPTEGS